MSSARRFALSILLCMAAACGRKDDTADDLDPSKLPSAGNCALGCNPGFKCSAGACALDPSGMWVMTVTSGKVSPQSPAGDAWDAFGGAPDPFVCLTIGTSRSCTRTAQDTFQPSWNERFPAATATAYLSGVTVSMVDEDLSSNDPICGPNVVPVKEGNFLLGQWTPVCEVGEFRVTLSPQ